MFKTPAPFPMITTIDENGKEQTLNVEIIKITFATQEELLITLSDDKSSQISIVAHKKQAHASIVVHPESTDSIRIGVDTQSDPTLCLTVQYNDEITTVERQKLPSKNQIQQWLNAALFESAELTIRFVGEKEGYALNQAHRKKEKPTNVLTFYYGQTPEDFIHADIVLCVPVVEKEAQTQQKTLSDHYAHLLIHGLLHAQGYDHETSVENQDEMENLEIKILHQFGINNPYF